MLICTSTFIMKFNKPITNSLTNTTEISEETDKCRESRSRDVFYFGGVLNVSRLNVSLDFLKVLGDVSADHFFMETESNWLMTHNFNITQLHMIIYGSS